MILLAAPLVLLPIIGPAQSGPQQPKRPVFPSGVASVVVDVLVQDQDGWPVVGLTREHFELLEDGVPQRIEAFEAVSVGAAEPEEVVPGPTSHDRESRADAQGRAPDVERSVARRFVLVLNRLNASIDSMRKAKKAMEEFVRQSMVDADMTMIVDLGMSARVVQPFTVTRAKALDAIKRGLVTMQVRDDELRVEAGLGDGLESQAMERRSSTAIYEALESLAEGLRRIDGRKVVVLFSRDLRWSKDLMNLLRRTISALNRSNASLYSIDIAGVPLPAAEGSRYLGLASEEPLSDSSSPTDLNADYLGALFPVANETGGRYFTNLNDFTGVMKGIADENRHYYLLGYVPTNTAINGKFRRITVKLRRPGMRVVARKGYLAGRHGRN